MRRRALTFELKRSSYAQVTPKAVTYSSQRSLTPCSKPCEAVLPMAPVVENDDPASSHVWPDTLWMAKPRISPVKSASEGRQHEPSLLTIRQKD